MAVNDDTTLALHYHEATKHSPESVRGDMHFLDWPNQPRPFKIYQGLSSLPLPEIEDRSEPAALDVLGRSDTQGGASLDLDGLARLLFYTAGITRRRRHANGEILFRAAACTGALYHVELYVAASEVTGLEAGLYHYGPERHELSVLRGGDWKAVLIEATAAEPHIARAAATIVLTTTFWRNAWKYRSRAYRHAFWDSGTMLANLTAEANALELEHHVLLGFADPSVNALLDVDPAKEAAVALVTVGKSGESVSRTPAPPQPLGYVTEPLSPNEVDYPLIREAHEASSLLDGARARAWRETGPESTREADRAASAAVPLEASPASSPSLEKVIRKRGSSRRFAREPIARAALATILNAAMRSVSGDVLAGEHCVSDAYVIVNAVDGLSAGAYVYHPATRELELLREGELRSQARFLDLEQDLAGDAAVNVYLLVDLAPVLETWGNRGYRVAQMEGGILGGRMYLAAYALGLGATGLTFFDDAVTDFFSPHAAGKAVMFLTAVGVPVRQRILFQR